MNADGTGKMLLLNEGSRIPSAQLSWSPDGTRIAFELRIAGGMISTVEATGGAPTLLVANAGAHYPSWAPDARPERRKKTALPASPPPGGSASEPPPMAPAPVLPARKPLKCGKGKKKKIVRNKVRCVKKRKRKRQPLLLVGLG